MKNLNEVDLSDESLRKQVISQIQKEITGISSQHEQDWLKELSECISKIFNSNLELVHKRLNLEKHIEHQKEKFQMTLDQTINMNDEELQQSKDLFQ